MDFVEAILSRKSIRAFKLDPVPKDIIVEPLAISQHAPSGTNTQSWQTLTCRRAGQ